MIVPNETVFVKYDEKNAIVRLYYLFVHYLILDYLFTYTYSKINELNKIEVHLFCLHETYIERKKCKK